MAKQTRKQRKAAKSRTNLSVTPLRDHQKIGKDVVPPLATLKNYPAFSPQDWTSDRLPEMLWAAVLIAAVGREEALERFRALGTFIAERCDSDDSRRQTLCKVTLSGIADWRDDEWTGFVEAIIRDEADAYSALRAFEELPGRERWLAVTAAEPNFEILKTAVGITLWHQSQEATDCRWMRVLAMLLSGSFQLPREIAEEYLYYPNHGDQRKVRPSVRSAELSADAGPDGYHVSRWSPVFWQRVFEVTKEDHRRYSPANAAVVGVPTLDAVRQVRESLRQYSDAMMYGTAVDARHEATFGLGAYALDILIELLGLSNSTGILARMGLRSLTEILINFATLARHDEPERWKRFRDYGYGQAKLAYLKMLETDNLPGFVTVETLEQLANEDLWHEFREMHIGNWNDSDLRKMSEANGMKTAVYDKYYDWSSAFVHANWAAVRDAEYDLCLNPLHRLHRVLALSRTSLPDVVLDACEIVNQILDLVDALFPTFKTRVKANPIAAI